MNYVLVFFRWTPFIGLAALCVVFAIKGFLQSADINNLDEPFGQSSVKVAGNYGISAALFFLALFYLGSILDSSYVLTPFSILVWILFSIFAGLFVFIGMTIRQYTGIKFRDFLRTKIRKIHSQEK
jgi:hypothetical protein